MIYTLFILPPEAGMTLSWFPLWNQCDKDLHTCYMSEKCVKFVADY